jgi:hypothetical protein
MRQLIADYAKGYDLIMQAIHNVSEEEMYYKSAPGQWSIKEIIIHLGDSETVVITRMKRIIAEDRPFLTTMQQNLWTEKLGYANIDHVPYLQLFKLLRNTMAEVLYNLNDDVFVRVGIHDELGEMTLSDMIRRYIDHVNGHVDQVKRARAAYLSRY